MVVALRVGTETVDSLTAQHIDGTRTTMSVDGLSSTAKFDALSDWFATIQNDDTLYIPPGIYEMSDSGAPLSLTKLNLNVFAQGAIIRRGVDVDSQYILDVNSASTGNGFCRISGLTIDGNRANHTSGMSTEVSNLWLRNYDRVYLEDCQIIDTPYRGLVGNPSPNGVRVFSSVRYTRFRGVLIRDAGYSSIWNTARNQWYYDTVCEITTPGMRAEDQYTYTFSGPTLTLNKTHDFSPGERCMVTSTGTIPTGLVAYKLYYVKTAPTSTTITLSESSGGSEITLSSGSGTHSLFKVKSSAVWDYFLRTENADQGIHTLQWFGGEWKCDLPIATQGIVSTDESTSDEDTFTVSNDSGDALFTAGGSHPFVVGDTVALRLEDGGTSLPGGFSAHDTYYVIEVPTSSTLKLGIGQYSPAVPYRSAEMGTLHLQQTYRAGSVNFHGLSINTPNQPGGESFQYGLIKARSVRELTLRNIIARSNNVATQPAGRHIALLELLGSDADGITDDDHKSGWRPNVLIEDSICESGGLLFSGGQQWNLVCNRSEFGHEFLDKQILKSLYGRRLEFNHCIFKWGDIDATVDMIDFDAAWDEAANLLFFNWCRFISRNASAAYIAAGDWSGGFHQCEIANNGAGTAYFANSNARRLKHNLANPSSTAVLVLNAADMAADTPASTAHPLEANLDDLTGLTGQAIVASDPDLTVNRAWLWSATDSTWKAIDVAI